MSASREEVSDYALGTLAEWLGGYTCPDEGPQQRVKVGECDETSLIISVEDVTSFPSDERWFRIEVRVTEVAPVSCYRDARGLIWESMPDGTWRATLRSGAYMQELSLDQVRQWYGPLTEVPQA